jgi:hypothetical protein
MATQPQHPVHNPAAPPPKANDIDGPAPAPVAPATYPGGMASDPAAALANEIITNLRGAPDRLRSRVDSTPALKAVMDQIDSDTMSNIAQSIRTLINNEVAKATGGMGIAPVPPTVVGPPLPHVEKK